jgi:transposase
LEASTESEWVARCLEGLGHEVIVADPNFAPMYATRTRKVKTDRRDARALTEANVLGAYRPAHRLSDGQRQVRAQLAVRDALVRTRTRRIALSRALLRQHGYRVAHRRGRDVRPAGGGPGAAGAGALGGGLLLALMRTVAYCETEIEHVSARDPRVRRLRTAPSIGPVTAAAFVATLDEATRFRRAHQVEAYLGLVPGEWSTGDGQRRGRITKTGNTRMRWLLIQAALSIMRLRDPRAAGLRTWARRIGGVVPQHRPENAGQPAGQRDRRHRPAPPRCDDPQRWAAGPTTPVARPA